MDFLRWGGRFMAARSFLFRQDEQDLPDWVRARLIVIPSDPVEITLSFRGGIPRLRSG